MGISTKRKRKIIFNDELFYWYVGKDPRDRFAKAIHIMSPDGGFLAIYRLDFVTEGSILYKLEIIKSKHIIPTFYHVNPGIHEETVTPKLVADILHFCLIGYKTNIQSNLHQIEHILHT